jgi:hypothetical protein
METIAPSQPVNGSWRDLFKPATPAATNPETPPASGSNAATGAPAATPSPVAGSAASGGSTVTAEQAFSGLDNTRISSISGSGASGQPGVAPLNGGTPSASVSLGGMVQGEWAVNIMDALLPAAMVAGFYALGMKLRKSELQLTQSEKNTIAPIMQKCLDSILLNFNNPWNALAVTIGAIYGGKLVEKGFVAYVEKKQEQKQDEALQERITAADKMENPAKHDYANQSAADIQSGNVALPGVPYTEEEVRAKMKKSKCNRENAIKWLNKKYGV